MNNSAENSQFIAIPILNKVLTNKLTDFYPDFQLAKYVEPIVHYILHLSRKDVTQFINATYIDCKFIIVEAIAISDQIISLLCNWIIFFFIRPKAIDFFEQMIW